MELYEIASFSSVSEFLLRVAHKRGKLKKGGVPDTEMAARLVLRDWNDGKIPFYTRAPQVEQRCVEDTQVVQQLAEPMQLMHDRDD